LWALQGTRNVQDDPKQIDLYQRKANKFIIKSNLPIVGIIRSSPYSAH